LPPRCDAVLTCLWALCKPQRADQPRDRAIV
jgi:hypothetical protein